MFKHTSKKNAVIIITMLLAAGKCFSSSSPEEFKRTARAERMRLRDRNVTAILDQIVFKNNPYIRPNYGGPPVDIGVSLYILSVSELSEINMDLTLDFYLRQTWRDPRLAFNPIPGTETLVVPADFIKHVWKPDTFIVNEKTSRFHVATTSNEFFRIKYTGVATRSIRLTVTAACRMDLRYFPMDKQLCNVQIESFGYTMKDIMYRWNDGPLSVDIASDVSLPQFTVIGYRQKDYEISLSTGNYSRLKCDIQFERALGYYVMQIYIPCILIVIVSWVSFWLPREATTARVFLGVTTVLTMTTLMSTSYEAMPKIPYVKALDIYVGTSFFCAFNCLIEYAIVGYSAKRISMKVRQFLVDYTGKVRQELRRRVLLRAGTSEADVTIELQEVVVAHNSNPPDDGDFVMQIDGQSIPRPKIPKKYERFLGTHPAEIDNFSRVAFPAGFVSFNLIYWSMCLWLSDSIAEDLTLIVRE